MFKIQKGYDSESKTFRLPIELTERLEILATRNKISLNQLVIQCLNYAITNLEDTETESEDKEQNTPDPPKSGANHSDTM
ncbi:MAG: toxin-antitoxin system HicB family antitoxin [Oscillospiraceae bacterium]|nr:toxin-antitoxin system HicB family antitoxin [Oscillospiraceae bacterium]